MIKIYISSSRFLFKFFVHTSIFESKPYKSNLHKPITFIIGTGVADVCFIYTHTTQNSLNIYIYTHTHTHTNTHMHTNIHTNIHTYIHACIHKNIHTCMHAYLHTYIHISL